MRHIVVIFTLMHFVLSVSRQKLHAAVHFREVEKKEKKSNDMIYKNIKFEEGPLKITSNAG